MDNPDRIGHDGRTECKSDLTAISIKAKTDCKRKKEACWIPGGANSPF
jgi:hypothetical protein